MELINTVSWSTVASRGSSLKVVTPELSSKEEDSRFRLIGSVMYQHEDLEVQMLARKATAIVGQALTSGSVLFSFPATLFAHRTLAYEQIEKQCGQVVGFRPISCYGQKGSTGGHMLIEARFKNHANALKAMEEGVTVGDISYKASSSKDTLAKKCSEKVYNTPLIKV